MKKIVMKFLTSRGENAYYKCEEAGKKESWQNRQIAKKVCRDTIIDKNPLTIEIKVKIPRLAIQIDLPQQIRDGLIKFNAEENIDYTMEVL